MKYWSLSKIADSKLLHPDIAAEVRSLSQAKYISTEAISACGAVAVRLVAAETPLMIVETVGAPYRRVYTSYPEFDDWLALERGGFVQTDSGHFGFVFDALH
jgi:hypothetical protein